VDILRNVPLGIYLESPRTWLHELDPRVKLAWLLSVLLSPILATNLWRILVVVVLMGLTFACQLPRRVWIRQLPLVCFFAIVTFVVTAVAPDGLGVTPHPQRQGPDIPAYGMVAAESPVAFSPEDANPAINLLSRSWEDLPPTSGYEYFLIDQRFLGLGPIVVTRRSLSLATRLGTLIFTLLYSTNLFLITTGPEAVAEGLDFLLRPLRRLKIPTAEIILTLTLALRFLPLVLEEVQNLVRSVRTRDIRWQTLGLRGTVHTLLTLVERLLENLLLRAEQTAAAMQARGYAGPQIPIRWSMLHLRAWDWGMLVGLPLFWLIRLGWFHPN
jgi:energy-coupling factor transport system permease protein